ncbi:MAG: hypothetical protein JWL72_3771 [Ilumatobacteraceae bacterium]|nr:hypothetical protein [Ilumatobacteraceae bacterium]
MFAAAPTPSPTSAHRPRHHHLTTGVVVSLIAVAGALAVSAQTAQAGIVPTVSLATAANYSVLGATTVSNTNPSVLDQSVGLSPGTSIVGFPPGIVLAPGIIDAASPTALQAQNDLTAAYIDAAGRSVEFTQTNPDLVGQTLIPGVYAATAKAPLGLSGQLVLDGQNDPNAVFIFQTDSTLITSTGSTIELINGASECNVFWQVGSSATLASGSVFVGNILALTSITVDSAVVVHGRALAQTGAVTLDNDTFTQPSCTPSTATTPPSTTPATTTPTTTTAAPTTTTAAPTTTLSTLPSSPAIPVTESTLASDVFDTQTSTTPFNVTDITLPRTGTAPIGTSLIAVGCLVLGAAALLMVRRRRPL